MTPRTNWSSYEVGSDQYEQAAALAWILGDVGSQYAVTKTPSNLQIYNGDYLGGRNNLVEIDDDVTAIPSAQDMQNLIDAKIPFILSANDHATVIDGYRGNGDGLQFHVHNLAVNDGAAAWRDYSYVTEGFESMVHVKIGATVDKSKVRQSDPLIKANTDTDGDGVLDFDEIYRFNTDPKKKDSDGDGVDDKTEIASYSIYRTANKQTRGKPLPDFSNAMVRPQSVADADGGGIPDGREDLNKNGLYEPNLGETDPYDAADDALKISDDMGNYAMIAFSELHLNDRSVCKNLDLTWCSVSNSATRGDPDKTELGSHAEIGTIVSSTNVVLRDYATVHGNLVLANQSNSLDCILNQCIDPNLVEQNGITIQGATMHNNGLMGAQPIAKYRVDQPVVIPNLALPACVVATGNTIGYLGNSCQSIKVEAGGTLIINGSSVYNLTSLQVDPGAFVGLDLSQGPIRIYVQGNISFRGSWFNGDLTPEKIAANILL